jgi:hypothetical protein
MTAIDQQREVTRYARGLNGWLEREVQDRQLGYEAISMRIDQYTHDFEALRYTPAV